MPKIIYCRVAWMNYYNLELCPMDKIVYGGSYTNKKKHEVYNFQKINNWYYGYVQVQKTIDITKLGAKPSEDVAKNVIVIWVAKNPDRDGQVVVGWYKDANVYSKYQRLNEEAAENREYLDIKNYNVSSKNAILLPTELRTIKIDKSILGQNQFAYAKPGDKIVNKIRGLIRQSNIVGFDSRTII